LMIRTLARLTTVDTGFRSDHLLTLQLSMRNARWNPDRRAEMTAAIVDDIQRIPGVTAAAASSSMPIVGSDWNSPFIVEGRPLVPLDRTPSAAITLVTQAYFETMATRLLAGRVFNAFDRRDSASVAVVNASLAAA